MRYKAFEHGKGNVKWAVRYVLAEHNHENEQRGRSPEILRGNAQDLLAVGDTIKNEWKYTSGVLSVSETPTPEQERELIKSFEDHCFAGMDESRRSVLWVKHKDHNHTEYHFIFNRVDLETGKAFNPMPPNQLHYFDKWMNHQNALNNWTRPDVHTNDVWIKKTDPNKELKKEVAAEMRTLIQAGIVENRRDLINYLDGNVRHDLKLKKQGDGYVTFTKEIEGKEKSIRFKGGIFDVANTYMYEKDYEPELVNQHWNADAKLISDFERQMLEAREAKAETHIKKYGELETSTEQLKDLLKKGNENRLNVSETKEPDQELEERVDRLTWHSSTKQQKNFYMTFSKVYEPEDVEKYKAWTSKNSDQHIHDSENNIHVKITGSTSTYNVGKNTSDESLTKMMLVDIKRRDMKEGETLSYVGHDHSLNNNFIICMARAQYQYNIENNFDMSEGAQLIGNLSDEDNEILFKTIQTEFEMRQQGITSPWTIQDQIEKEAQENSVPIEQDPKPAEPDKINTNDYISEIIEQHAKEPSTIELLGYKMRAKVDSDKYQEKKDTLSELRETQVKFPEVEDCDLFPQTYQRKRAIASLGQDKVNELENVYEAMKKIIKDFGEGVDSEETKDWDVRDLVKYQEQQQEFAKSANNLAAKAHSLTLGISESERLPDEHEHSR